MMASRGQNPSYSGWSANALRTELMQGSWLFIMACKGEVYNRGVTVPESLNPIMNPVMILQTD